MKTFILGAMLALTAVSGAVVISDPAAAVQPINGGMICCPNACPSAR